MSKEELTRIAIAAAVAVVFKELLSWFIRTSKPVATVVAKIIGRWMLSMAFVMEFAVDVFVFMFWVAVFCSFPDNGNPVTYASVRLLILFALFAVAQLFTVRRSFRRWSDSRHRPNQSPEPTADGAFSSASRATRFGRLWLSFFR